MIRRPPRSTRTDTLFPNPTLFLSSFDDHALEQLTLFDMHPDPEVLRQRLLVEDSELTRYCAAIVADHARRYGWSVRQRNAVIQSRSEEHTSELQSLMRISYAVFCLTKKNT